MTESLGEQFVRAVADKDHGRLLALLHPELDFRAMTPNRIWEAAGPGEVVGIVRQWFEDTDLIEGIDRLDTDAFADRERVGYRLRVRNPDGLHVVDQQAYLTERDGRIGWLRIMCAGYRPAPEAAAGRATGRPAADRAPGTAAGSLNVTISSPSA